MERSCAQWQADFWHVLDGELPEAESAALSNHLHGCMACRKAACAAVAMHRNLLEAVDRRAEIACTVELPAKDATTRLSPSASGRRRLLGQVIVIDARMIGAAAVLALAVLGWSVSGLAAEGISEVRNALQGASFSR